MDGLMGLVNKSLVNVEEQEHESRYRFLETIRQYSMEKLSEAGESEFARDRHFDYILKLAQSSSRELFGTESLQWLDQMDAEHDNLRAALEWSMSSDPIKARRVCWRSSAVRLPPVSSLNLSSRRSAICAGVNNLTRAAANSIARGIPSRREQIWAMDEAFSSVSLKRDSAFVARSTKSRVDSSSFKEGTR